MTSGCAEETAAVACEQYRALFAVSEAIALHRDLQGLFHELAGRLHEVVQFDYLVLLLHDSKENCLRVHTLEPEQDERPAINLPVDGSPAGLVWQTQEPLVISNNEVESRWPEFWPQVRKYGTK